MYAFIYLPTSSNAIVLVEQIGYWEVYDGSAIRELEGSLSGSINGMHISEDGKYFVTGRHFQYLFPYKVIFPKSIFCHMADVTGTTGGTIDSINRSIYNSAEKASFAKQWDKRLLTRSKLTLAEFNLIPAVIFKRVSQFE